MKVNEAVNLIRDNYPLYSLYSAEEFIAIPTITYKQKE